MTKFTPETAAIAGRKGGRATVTKHGRAHMQSIGVRGFWATVTRHWDGDARKYVNFLLMMGWAATDPMPHNGAFEHNAHRIRCKALSGKNYLRPQWRPPPMPEGLDIDPPF